MGVSMTWHIVKPDAGKSFATGSTLHAAMVRAFGNFPLTLNTDDVKIIEGMVACGYDDLYELIQAILEHNVIKVEDHW